MTKFVTMAIQPEAVTVVSVISDGLHVEIVATRGETSLTIALITDGRIHRIWMDPDQAKHLGLQVGTDNRIKVTP